MPVLIAVTAALAAFGLTASTLSGPSPGQAAARLAQLARRWGQAAGPGDPGLPAGEPFKAMANQAGLTPAQLNHLWSQRPVHTLLGLAGGLAAAALLSLPVTPVAFAGALAGWWWLRWRLGRAAAHRQRLLEEELPVFVERFSLGSQAGLNVRQAFRLAAGRTQGPLGELARRVLDRMELGAGLEEALAPELAGVAPGPVRLVLTSLAQAERVGASLTAIIRQQADFVRQLGFFRLQQSIEALPLKLTICGIIFLFPPVFIVLLVPNLISFFQAGW